MSDSLESNYLRLFFKEAEVVCRLFADKFQLDKDVVLQHGLGYILKRHPEVRQHLLLSDAEIKELSLPDLKQECRVRKLKVGGNKNVLQERLTDEVTRLRGLLDVPSPEDTLSAD